MPKRSIIAYEPRSKGLARQLRRAMTIPEKELWARLRRKALGVSFYRQRPIGPYIVDFYAPDARLVIEVDGSSHTGQEALAKDAERQTYLEGLGLAILRFDNQDVLHDLNDVIRGISGWLEAHAPDEQLGAAPHVPPLKGDRGMSEPRPQNRP